MKKICASYKYIHSKWDDNAYYSKIKYIIQYLISLKKKGKIKLLIQA